MLNSLCCGLEYSDDDIPNENGKKNEEKPKKKKPSEYVCCECKKKFELRRKKLKTFCDECVLKKAEPKKNSGKRQSKCYAPDEEEEAWYVKALLNWPKRPPDYDKVFPISQLKNTAHKCEEIIFKSCLEKAKACAKLNNCQDPCRSVKKKARKKPCKKLYEKCSARTSKKIKKGQCLESSENVDQAQCKECAQTTKCNQDIKKCIGHSIIKNNIKLFAASPQKQTTKSNGCKKYSDKLGKRKTDNSIKLLDFMKDWNCPGTSDRPICESLIGQSEESIWNTDTEECCKSCNNKKRIKRKRTKPRQPKTSIVCLLKDCKCYSAKAKKPDKC